RRPRAARSQGLPSVSGVADPVVARFEVTARRRPEKVALRWDGGALTYRQLDRRAGGFARALHHGGVRAGDRVALVIGNRAAVVASWIAPVMALTADDVVLAVLPLSHSYGLNGALLAPLVTGATVGLLERFSPEAVLGSIRDLGVSVFPGVATMFRRLLDADA